MPKTKKTRKAKKPHVEEDIFIVEKILKKKITGGKTYYFLKWSGYPDSENTWEPVDNLDCPELIEDFERHWSESHGKPQDTSSNNSPLPASSIPSKLKNGKTKGKQKTVNKTIASSPLPVTKVEQQEGSPVLNGGSGEEGSEEKENTAAAPSGFTKGWEAEEILGATEESGQILFLIKW